MLERAWYGGAWWSMLLLPFSALFWLISSLRRSLYTLGVLSQPELTVPVIIVGNISIGGTGKTPVVAWLVQQLLARGYQPGIVSRGYGGSHTGRARILSVEDDAALVGDEPLLLAQKTGVPVCVATDRPAGVRKLTETGVNIVVADDGLQHYRMRRDVELIVIDAERGLGNGYLLPAGPLRESSARLKTADAVILNGQSSQYKGVSFSLSGDSLVSLAGDNSRELSSFSGKQVWGIAGIGNPQRFYKVLESAGLQVDPVSVPDHGVADLQALSDKKHQPLIMTEKDAVKYAFQAPEEAWYLPVEAEFSADDTAALMRIITAKLA
ncbi:MAG: tetraacyldisaccharide 4'-kinase [Gammaproteobacteria bacterium]